DGSTLPHLASQIDGVVVDDDVAHARTDVDTANAHLVFLPVCPVLHRLQGRKGKCDRPESLEMPRAEHLDSIRQIHGFPREIAAPPNIVLFPQHTLNICVEWIRNNFKTFACLNQLAKDYM